MPNDRHQAVCLLNALFIQTSEKMVLWRVSGSRKPHSGELPTLLLGGRRCGASPAERQLKDLEGERLEQTAEPSVF